MNRYEEDIQRVKQQEKEFLAKYQNPETGKLVNVPVQGRTPEENSITERLQFAIANDPRSRFAGELTEDVIQRRKAGWVAEEKSKEESRAKSSGVYEKRVFDHLESMGLPREYGTSVPQWAAQMREENEE